MTGSDLLQGLGSRRRFPANSFLFTEGDQPTAVYVVLSGLTRLERVTPGGRSVLVELAAAGQMVGELGVLSEEPRSASFRTVESSFIQIIPGVEFVAIFRRDPDVALDVTRRIIRRMRVLTDQLVQASGRSATGRIAGRLTELLDRLPADDHVDPVELLIPISQEELGQWAGLSREGTAKALREMRDLGVITTGRNRVTVLKQAELRRIALRSD